MRGNRGNRGGVRGTQRKKNQDLRQQSFDSDHREQERNLRGRGARTRPGPRSSANQRGTYKHKPSDQIYQDSHHPSCYEPHPFESNPQRRDNYSQRSERYDGGRINHQVRYPGDIRSQPDLIYDRQRSMDFKGDQRADYPGYGPDYNRSRNYSPARRTRDYSPERSRSDYFSPERTKVGHNSSNRTRSDRYNSEPSSRNYSPEIGRRQYSSIEDRIGHYEREYDRRCPSPDLHRDKYGSSGRHSPVSHRQKYGNPERERRHSPINRREGHYSSYHQSDRSGRESHRNRPYSPVRRDYSAERSSSANRDGHYIKDRDLGSNPSTTVNLYLPESRPDHHARSFIDSSTTFPFSPPPSQIQLPPQILQPPPLLLPQQPLLTPYIMPRFQCGNNPGSMKMPMKYQPDSISTKQVTNFAYKEPSMKRATSTSSINSTDSKSSVGRQGNSKAGKRGRGGERDRGRRGGGTPRKGRDDTNSDSKTKPQNDEVEKKKTAMKESLLFMRFSTEVVDEKFDFKTYLAKRTECLQNVSYQIEGYKQIDDNYVVIVACPSKAASTKLIKHFRKTNSSSDIEVLCYQQQKLPKTLSVLQNFKIEALSTDQKEKSMELNPRKKKKTKKAKTKSGKDQEKICIETCVYIVINDSVKHDDAEGFLKTRMSPFDTFSLTECKIDDDGKNTRVLITVPSENIANEVIKVLEESNNESQTKIICSLVPISEHCNSIQEKIDLFLDNVNTRSKIYLEKHQEKIKLQELRIGNNTMKPNISIGEYERRMGEINALKLKLSELKSQEYEYRIFIEKQREKITACSKEHDIDTILQDQRKLFGIENLRLESALPIYARRTDILQCIRENQVTIIRGETGSGKSTQLVQYIYEEFSKQKSIVCTQPRKVACISLAKRVSEELAVPLGRDVIHRVGTKYKLTDKAKIVFMTDHTLLNECLKDPLFSRYSCIIIDEAHERTIYTDVLLGIIKKCLLKRDDVKVIISSATIDIKVFSDYFTNCKSMQIAGRMFPVEVIWLSEEDQAKILNDYSQAAVDLAVKIHKEGKEGDILVFMTTPLETEKCRDKLIKIMDSKDDYKCLVLHGQLPSQEQQEVFELVPGKRKIVFATNSAETSITIPGVTFVIDTGLAKEKKFDPKRNMNSLCVDTVSRSSAEQRKGRAGRTAPGKCYRLYTQKTYEEMKPSNTPEILRIHLGQILLKLLELNIHPNDCDFVESPKPEAIQSAIKLLKDLNAMENGVITEKGKWLSKIPFEPLLGSLIKQGFDKGLIYDAIALTSLISTEGSLFYRAGTDDDKRKLDLLKTTFCDPRGDCFTLLNVYKEWIKISENKKKKWTLDNGINIKSIQAVQETLLETITVLKNDLKLEVKCEFHNDENSLETLQKILIKTFIENTAHYMGHRKAGYFIPLLKQQVFLHPSSALLALNTASEWVVYMNLLQTSSDFILTVTPIKEEWLHELDREKQLPFVIEEVKHNTILNVCSVNFGPVSFSSFVGPRYTKLRKYEEILSEKCSSKVMLDADKDLGEVKLFSSNFVPQANEILQEWVREARCTIANRSLEHKLGTKAGQNEGVRIVLGPGGQGSLMLMPKEYRSVFISKPNPKTTTKERIYEKFSRFGKIIDCFEERHAKNRWGRVKFESPDVAAFSVEETKQDSEEVAIPEFKVYEEGSSAMFRVRMEWHRRQTKRIAFVDIDLMYLPKANRMGRINILGTNCPVHLDKKTASCLCVSKLPDEATEKDILDSFHEVLELETEDEKKMIEAVRLIREKGFHSSAEDLKDIKESITEQLLRTFERNSFTVDVLKPKKDTDIKFTTIVKFTRPEDGYQCLKETIYVKGEQVKITPDNSSKINISKNLYNMMKETLDETVETLQRESALEFKHHINTRGNERVVINLYSAEPDDLARVRSSLEALLKGEVIDCWGNENYSHVFGHRGKQFIRELEASTDTLIQLDERRYKIIVYGKEDGVKSAQTMIDNYLNDIITRTVKDLNLRAAGMPHGVMKALVRKYGINVDALVAECDLNSACLDHRRHVLRLYGESTAIKRAESVVWDLIAEIGNIQQAPIEEDHPDCCACFCPVDDISQLCRLECCGHAYCFECLNRQISVAIQCKELPVVCGSEGCHKPLFWHDFTNIFKKSKIVMENLIDAAVTNFMMKDIQDSYRHCLTPDCPLVYRSSKTGVLFTCSECNLRICTSCHVEYHDGLSCAMYQRNKIEKMEVEKYLKEHGDSTKCCPSCRIPIEKNHGCNRMECLACKTIFCWLCLEKFASSNICYEHLNARHGGIANEEDLLYD